MGQSHVTVGLIAELACHVLTVIMDSEKTNRFQSIISHCGRPEPMIPLL